MAVLCGLIYSLVEKNLYGYTERPNLIKYLLDCRYAGRIYNRPTFSSRLDYLDIVYLPIGKVDCLELISRRYALKKPEAFPPRLNVRNSEDTEPYKRILAIISIVYRPIAFNELASLIELPDDLYNDSKALLEIIAICGLFLTICKDTIIFVYQSIKEFLLREM
ncbi:hypothetical protein N7472_004645 [Penicillium cf. griseofulvum]|uniref:Uncharacterized protein n=1 Tax=Penicillium cf. griseofulvum TaxID=2972120 RepID=A0A9W9JT85_9EURO|nr:hypothetical protein N7472_004645 [Penicillium cf. griseofulvum]